MSFRLPCLKKLVTNLGHYDAVVEFTEVSIRAFMKNAKEAGDFNGFLSTQAAAHKIRVDAVSLPNFRSRISQSYILSVFQTAELFLHEFRKECNKIYETTITVDANGDLMTRTIKYLLPARSSRE